MSTDKLQEHARRLSSSADNFLDVIKRRDAVLYRGFVKDVRKSLEACEAELVALEKAEADKRAEAIEAEAQRLYEVYREAAKPTLFYTWDAAENCMKAGFRALAAERVK